ncbi:forkhead box protein N3-like isoform X2 [Cylas formicarius]|uniref:forkhead box protein N3-like isoform X2 n=1 Tax=Cylas formicarius TaxID=197179 RepID=UPI0029583DF2|nr:forkhead box protein N3-like isoform X2 [Cylas formicarius]
MHTELVSMATQMSLKLMCESYSLLPFQKLHLPLSLIISHLYKDSFLTKMSPERPSSAQDEVALATLKMSAPGSPEALTPHRDAQSPISILLAVAQSQKNNDDDLTSLSWLHERDVLKGMNINTSPLNSTNSTPIKNGTSVLSDLSPTSDYVDESSISTPESSTCSSVNSSSPGYHQTQSKTANGSYNQNGSQRSRHPHNVPYDPLVHTNNKPPYSFSCLIFMAIEDSVQKALPVKEIYAWILDHFPYFRNAPTGWKNSVRHNLSLNKCFQKVEKAPNLGKGSLWTVDPQYKPNLIQALNRSPFYPCSVFDSPQSIQQSSTPPEKPANYRVSSLPNPELFPFLSKKLAAKERTALNGDQIKIEGFKIEQEESLDEVDAAAVMLSLKNGVRLDSSKKKVQPLQVITTSPSQDHTYSAADSDNNEDEAFESDEDKRLRTRTCRRIDFEDDEERKIKEGAETLLNLAGIATRKRTLSQQQQEFDPSIKKEKEEERKQAQFKPRLLRTKRKDRNGPKVRPGNNQQGLVKHTNQPSRKESIQIQFHIV